MNKPPRSTCPDCNGTLQAIKIIDHGEGNFPTKAEYAEAAAKRSFWGLGLFPIAGGISARVCDDCGRILFYAEPKPPR